MTRSSTRLIRYIAIILASVTLFTACQTSPYASASQRTPAAAEKYASEGNHTAAASIYRYLADQSTGIQRDKYLLEVAQQLFELERYVDAQNDLAMISTLMDSESYVRKILLQTRIFLELEQADLALRSINTLNPQSSPEIARPYFALKGRASFELGLLSEGIRQFIAREAFLFNRAELQYNRDRLWLEINDKIMQGYLEEYDQSDALVAGWLSLAEALANVPSIRLQKQIISRWRETHPDHPAFEVALNNLYSTAERFEGEIVERLDPIERVGVLLPLSGRLSKASEVIRQGIEMANRKRSIPLSISFHDTSIDTLSAYREAMSYQVDALIGPLSKDNILDVFGYLDETPALVLNRIDAYLGMRGLLQFGLAPEDEAILAAQFALDQGYTQAVTLTPNNEWGERVVEQFVLAFNAGGGIVLEQAIYSARDNDHSTAITEMLNIDESKQRFQRLRYLIGDELEYEKRRRQDVDFIFLAAKPTQGRAIRPQLNFHQALRVPVIATSDIYEADAVRNKDLNGIQLPLSEWVIDPINRDALLAIDFNVEDDKPANSQLLQLFSLGFDSVNYLGHLTMDPQQSFTGLSGELSIDEYGVVHRNLPLAVIKQGEIEITQQKQEDTEFVFDDFFFEELDTDFYDPSFADPDAPISEPSDPNSTTYNPGQEQ